MQSCHYCGYDNKIEIVKAFDKNRNREFYIAECSCGARGAFCDTREDAEQCWDDISIRYICKDSDDVCSEIISAAEEQEIKHMNFGRRRDFADGVRHAVMKIFSL